MAALVSHGDIHKKKRPCVLRLQNRGKIFIENKRNRVANKTWVYDTVFWDSFKSFPNNRPNSVALRFCFAAEYKSWNYALLKYDFVRASGKKKLFLTYIYLYLIRAVSYRCNFQENDGFNKVFLNANFDSLSVCINCEKVYTQRSFRKAIRESYPSLTH